MSNNKKIIIPIENIMSDCFGQYAKYIIQDRALPDVRDGLKPVQRRIIYAMYELNLLSTLPHKKSARTVGEVIGKYHPHGDSSIYEAMVRLSQEWKNNLCLLDMHGNKGSIDGDGPAAMRYTECRLSKFGQMLIEGIEKDVVDFIANFDGSEHEPVVLPSIYPNLLINGANGIAAGYATNIPPFNPNEVADAIIAKIDNPNCTITKILNIMPGPDFPTGGIISDLEGIREAYKTGKGKIIISGQLQKVSNKQIIIKSIPFETNKTDIIKSIDMLAQKYDTLGINEVRDESDANGISIVLETKTSANFDFITNFLYKHSKLQVAYYLNMIAIKNRKPILFDILNFLQSFIDHADEIISKTAQYDFNKAKSRKEIVEALIKAISIIDDVVFTIRHATDKASAVKGLMNQYSFNQNQAEAIVNLKLYRLTNSDISQLRTELANLNEVILVYENLIKNKDARYLQLKNKLREFKKLFPTPRKTQLSHETNKATIDELDLIENKKRIFTFTSSGYMKSFSNRILASNDPKDNFVKPEDLIVKQYVANLRDRSLLFMDNGQCMVVPNHKIESCKFKDVGVHINNLITCEGNPKLIAAINSDYKNVDDKTKIVVCTKKNLIKVCFLSELVTKRTSGIIYAKLDVDDKVVSVFPITDEKEICICSKMGYINCYPIDQIPFVSKSAKGVKAMNLKEDDCIASCVPINSSVNQLVIVSNYALKRITLEEVNKGSRTNIGKSLSTFFLHDSKAYVIKLLPVKNGSTIVYLDKNNKRAYISCGEINYLNHNARINSVSVPIVDAQLWTATIQNSEEANE